jgi:tRNA (guanine-N7-)-methyltransferase
MPLLDYNIGLFTQGRMNFTWEELSDEERRQAYADWEAGRGFIGGDPRRRSGSRKLPQWGLNRHFFRTLALDDPRGDNGVRLRAELSSDRVLEMEIGYGRGDFILDRALRHPNHLFIAYETRTKATRLCLDRIEALKLENLWLCDDDARFAIPRVINDNRAQVIHILFPDPWWKATHRARRLFSPPFVDLLAAKLRPGGLLHFKSDVHEYGEFVRYLVESQGAFAPHNPGLAEVIGDFAPTHREHWCAVHEKPVHSYFFRRLELAITRSPDGGYFCMSNKLNNSVP